MSKQSEFIKALLDDSDSEYGWLSDAQDADLDASYSFNSISFCGEGSIDVAHIASIAEQIWGRK